MLILSRDDMKKALSAAELFEALTQGFQMLSDGLWKMPLRTAIEMPPHQGVSLFMPSYCEGLGALGMKLVTVMSANPARGLPLIHSNYMYASADTGEVLSLMDAEYMTGLRTAVVSAMVTDLLGKSGGRTLAVFGTGVQAWFHVEVFAALFEIGEVLVFGRSREQSEQFAVRIERQLRKPARGAVMAELKRAEIICTCTTSEAPLFGLHDLRADAHVNAVGAYRPGAREIGSEVVANAILVVDSHEAALQEAGDIVIPLHEGAIRPESIHASIAELVSGKKPAPESDHRLTLFKSVGMAMEDLVAADLAYKNAKQKGIGTEVSF